MMFVTREYARVDRIACPWLIIRFIDGKAGFLFVPKEEVMQVAEENGAIPFDTPGAELHHYMERGEERCSFDAIIRKYQLRDAALLDLAEIVRGADCRLADPRAESAGLKAVAMGFRAIAKDDHDNMRLQFPLYDALYRYCQDKVEARP
jgi:hypothetical protein